MIQTPVGLHDLSIYVPCSAVNLEKLVKMRIGEMPEMERHLLRALKTTGQKEMRFPRVWEDTITLAAEACLHLLRGNHGIPRDKFRFLTLGTETTVDMSKAGSNYVLGMLEKAGEALPATLSSYQVQHACAGGALSLITMAGFLQAAGRDNESGIVLTSDIARYHAPSTAEVTQGAGATALLVGMNPKLLTLELDTAGFYSRDVDDFFRPIGSITAKVKGSYSVQCYNEALLGAFEDHCTRQGVSPAEELNSIDIFCLHVPYSLMPLGSMNCLLKKHLGFDEAASKAFLQPRGFFSGLVPASLVGNIYTGSLFLSLAYSLKERANALGPDLVGKRVMLGTYGSGNTMSVVTGRVTQGALSVISHWKLESLLEDKCEDSIERYLEWLSTEKTPANYASLLAADTPDSGRFYLAGLREDGYREYARS